MPLELEAVVVGLEASIQRAMNIAGKNAKIDLGTSSKAIDSLSQPLGRITGQADQFGKSMEAANARVLAFGASVGILGTITRGFQEMISVTIQVEKSLANINSVMGASSAQLNKFKNDIFSIAKETGNSFQTVSEAALELSRQGLKSDEVLRRLKDSMVLSRLSGMDAANAVEGLTAAVNSFSKSGITTTEVLNKIAKTAAAYSVSEKDLIEGFKRSASVAQQAGVSLDELGGIITAVQEKTARGGAVIGNAFKTIFTRIQRPDSLAALEEVGAAVTDMQGGILPATKLIENLAQKMNSLSDIQKANITEKIGGGFQIGPLLAALDDLTGKTSTYMGATQAMASAGNEAYARNTALNKTLAASINETTVNLQELANTLGEIGVTDSLKNILSFFSSLTTNIKDLLQGEGIGSDLANGIIKGLSGIITGPGFVIFGAIIAKLTYGLVAFGAESLKAFFGIGQAQKEINALASSLTNTLMTNQNIHKAVLSLEGNHVAQATLLGNILKQNNAEMQRFVEMGKRLAPGAAAVFKAGGGSPVKTSAEGYMPAVAQESFDIKRGVGGANSSNKPVVIPNFAFGGGKVGTMVANDSEYVVNNYGGSGGSAIFNKDMVSKIGLPSGAQKINSAGGFVPNFVDIKKLSAQQIGSRINLDPSDPKYISREDARNAGYKTTAEKNAEKALNKEKSFESLARLNAGGKDFGMIVGERGVGTSESRYADNEGRITETRTNSSKYLIDVPIFRVNDKNLKFKSTDKLTSQLSKVSASAALKMAKDLSGNVLPEPANIELIQSLLNKGSLTATAGAIFEAGIAGILKDDDFKDFKAQDRNSLIDFRTNPQLRELFGVTGGQAGKGLEAKANAGPDLISSTAGKILKINGYGDKKPQPAFGKAASGYIPNFANYIYDSDKLTPELRASILPAILSSKKRKDGILGPAGSGKSTMAGGIGQFIQSMGDIAKATGFTILSGAALAKTPTGISKQFQPILNAIKSSGGSLKYLNVGDAEIKRRREARVATGSNDLRSDAQLKGSSFAPLNQPEFLDILKKEMGGSFQVINAAKGFMPNFADPLKEAISREVSAGVNPSQVYIDQNSSLKNFENPMGLMVANRRDEPAGGWQGIARARKEGADITAYGAAGGFIPNFAGFRGQNPKYRPSTNSSNNDGSSTEPISSAADKAAASLDKVADSADQTNKGQKDHLGTIFAVQLAMSGLSAAFGDATSGAGLVAKRFADAGSSITTAVFAMQALQKIGTEGSKLSGVMGKLGTAGIVAAVAFEGFNLIRNVARDWTGATDQANKSTAAFKDQVDKAGISLSSLSNLEQLTKKQTAKDLIYNIQDKTGAAVGSKEFQGQMAEFQYLSGLTGSGENTQAKIKEILQKGGALEKYQSGTEVQTRINEDKAPEVMAAYLRSAEGQKEINRLKEEGKKITEETTAAVEKTRIVEQINFDIVKNRIKSELEIATLKARQKDTIDRQLSSAQILGNLSDDQIRSLEKQAALRDQDRSTSDEIKGILLGQVESSKALFADAAKFESIKKRIQELSTDELLNDDLRNKLLQDFSNLNDEVTNKTLIKNKGEISSLKEINDLKKQGLSTSLNQKQTDFDSLKIMKDAVSAAQELTAKKSFQTNFDAQSQIYAKDARKNEIDRVLAAGNLSESTIRSLNAEKARLDAGKVGLEVTKSQSDLLKKAKDQLLGTQAAQGFASIPISQQVAKSGSVEDVITQLKNPMLALNKEEADKRLTIALALEKEKLSLDQSSAANIAAAQSAADLAGILPGVTSAATQMQNAFSQTAIQQSAQNAKFAAMTETSGRKLAEYQYIQDTAKMQEGKSESEAAQIAKDRSVKGIGQKFTEAFSETEYDRADRFSSTLVSGAEKFRDTMIDGMSKAIEEGGSLGDILSGAALDFAREMTKTNMKNLFSSFMPSPRIGFASGGKITGGSGTKDDVPAMLMGGEYVMNKKAVSKYGPQFMEKLNNGTLSHFASGGAVGNQDKYKISSGGLGSSSQIMSSSPTQTGEGGFYMPGYYGAGTISGKKDLLSYASQAYTSGAKDITTSGRNFAGISLEGESAALTNFGRTQGPMAQAIAESKGQSFDLYKQQIEQEAAIEKARKDAIKARQKGLKTALITAVASAAISGALNVAKTGFQQGIANGGGFMGGVKGVGEKFGNVGSSLNSLFKGDMQSASQYSNMANTNFNATSGIPKGILSGLTNNTLSSGLTNNISSRSLDVNRLVSNNRLYTPNNASDNELSTLLPPFEESGSNINYNRSVLPLKRATGGPIPQIAGIDTVPAMLSGGEFIMNQAATQRIGPANLNSMNSGTSGAGKDSKELNDKLISKLDELIAASKESGKGVTVNVASNGKEETKSQGSSEQDKNLSRKIKEAVVKVLQEEKRLGGVLRRS